MSWGKMLMGFWKSEKAPPRPLSLPAGDRTMDALVSAFEGDGGTAVFRAALIQEMAETNRLLRELVNRQSPDS